MPETGVSQTRVQDHGKRERQSMDFGPPRPVGRAYLAIRRDGHRVPEITSKVRPRELSGIDIVPLPFDDPVRHLRGTLEHELVAHPALLALRHVMHLNMRTADLIYNINTNYTHSQCKQAVMRSRKFCMRAFCSCRWTGVPARDALASKYETTVLYVDRYSDVSLSLQMSCTFSR